jgi:molecular chaperone DnaK
MHVGIDLGTTNSVLALYDGSAVSVLPNAQGESLTPSVVRIDGRGNVTVGRRAHRYLETDAANTRAEFKRLMGTGERIRFDASGREMLPEELSSLILGSLLGDARDALGFAPHAVVVSTPALFELPQNHATLRAGRLAGLEEVVLIQEPIASAIAAGWSADAEGLWLVYDLGGGTLDVSLLETRDGWLRVVDHWGDNFLGGKDFDEALTDWALSRLHAEGTLAGISRSDPASRRTLRRLKAACEQTRIELSRQERAAIVCQELVDTNGLVDVDLEITRAELESLLDPLIERSLQVCRVLLGRAKVAPDAVGRIVFVGGPTLTPSVRRRVGEVFGHRVAEGMDPMTLVARGAALYAATAGLEARPVRAGTPVATPGLALRVEHPAVTSDSEPFVVGRFLPTSGEALPARVRIEREDRGFVSPEEAVSPEGSFLLQARLERHRQNRFRIVALAADGSTVPLQTPELAIVHGFSVADPPLSRRVGVALSDNTVTTYFEKGTPLPARRTVAHQTTLPLHPGGGEDVLAIPIVQGEYSRAHLNRLIGTLRIRGDSVRAVALPAGARVEVTLQLDRSGQLYARADVPSLGQTFEDVVHVLVPSASLEVLEREMQTAGRRLEDLQRRGFRLREPELVRRLTAAAAMLREASAGMEAARGGDGDAAQKTHRLLLDLEAELDVAEEGLRWPELDGEAEEQIHIALYWIGTFGSEGEQKLSEAAVLAIQQARKKRDLAELDRQLRILRSLSNAAYRRDPESPAGELEWYEQHVAEAVDVPRAHQLVQEGRRCLERQDRPGIVSVLRQLVPLFPGDEEERRRSFDSGLR